MKFCALTSLVAGCIVLNALSSLAEETVSISTYRTAPLTIDGNLDKPAWKSAVRIPIVYEMFTKREEANAAATGYYMVAWDEHYLYIAYDWTSATRPTSAVWEDPRGPRNNPRAVVRLNDAKTQYDCFEFFIAMHDDANHFWELQHNDRNALGDYFCIKPRDKDDPIRSYLESAHSPVVWLWPCYLQDDGEYTVKTAVHEKITQDGGKEIYAGYSAELRLPLKSIGAGFSLRRGDSYQLAGQKLRAFAAESRHTKPSYFQSIKGLHDGWFHDAVPRGQLFVFEHGENDKK